MLTLRGSTRVAGVIGDPVAHSLSPIIHNAAFEATGLDWVYVAFPVPPGQVREAVAAIRALGLAGLSVTMPHKEAVIRALDRLTPTAAALGAVNTVSVSDAELLGDSTDGAGLLDALAADGHGGLADRRVVVLGTGGAARAVTLAAAHAGAAHIGVVGRRPVAVDRCVALAGRAGEAVGIGAVATADVVINATPVGMSGAGLPFDVEPGGFKSGQLVVDLVYSPSVTPLLAAAVAAGAVTTNGLGMLVHQAGRQFTSWTGRPAPLDAMTRAIRAATAG